MIIDSRPKISQPVAVDVSSTIRMPPSVPPSPTSLVDSALPPYDARFPRPVSCAPASTPADHAEMEALVKKQRRRTWLSFSLRVAFCLWVFASAYVALVQLRKLAERVASLVSPVPSTFGRPDLDEQQLGIAVSCGKWRYSSVRRVSFQTHLPEDTARIFLHNLGGPLVTGSLHVFSGPYHHPQLRVDARSKYSKVLKERDVCLMKGDKSGTYGLLISTPAEDDEIDYTINLIVPERTTDLQLKTRLPRFRHVIGMPGSNSLLQLKSMFLSGPVASLNINSAEVGKLHIDTVDSFYGSLTVTESLSIKSTAGSIDANVTLLYKGQPLRVSFEADHDSIDAIIRVKDFDLDNDPTLRSRPVPLNITATTGHAPIALGIIYNSSNVVLGIDATTKLAPLYIQVPLSYEGTFNITALSSEAKIQSSPSDLLKDPLDEGRKRLITLHSPNPSKKTLKWNVIGSIEWVCDPDDDDDEDVGEGDVVRESSPAFKGSHLQATTLLAKVVLDLPDSERLLSETSSWGHGCVVKG